MSNPIFSSPNPSFRNQQPNSLLDMYRQLRQSPNPEVAFQNMLINNPQFQNVMNYINQNGGDAKSAFYNLAAQKGVNPNDILSQLR